MFDELRLVHDPLYCAGTIKLATNDNTPLTEGVLAQVNGNPMSNDERNAIAAEIVRRWNLVPGNIDNIPSVDEDDHPVRW